MQLPELDERAADCEPDVRIVLLDPIAVKGKHAVEVDGDVVRITVPEVALFESSSGRQIAIARHFEASDRDIRLFLLGSAFAAILHQRGLLPIHSNAIELHGRAVAFIGHSGAGKSTMAAWLHDRGHALLSDDVCVIDAQPDGGVLVHRGVPRLRLWRDSLEASGRSAREEELMTDQADKYTLRTRAAPVSPDTVPLSHFYLLNQSEEEGAEPEIRPMTPGQAARALIENTYRGSYVRSLSKVREHLQQCVDLAQSTPMFELRRPWDLDRLGELCERVEAHARSLGGGDL